MIYSLLSTQKLPFRGWGRNGKSDQLIIYPLLNCVCCGTYRKCKALFQQLQALDIIKQSLYPFNKGNILTCKTNKPFGSFKFPKGLLIK
jgi:hypothetical protein